MNRMRFTESVCIVTGAASGIGRAVAQTFAHQGAAVMVADIDEPAACSVVDALVAEGANARVVAADISNPASVEEMIRETVSCFGRLDVLVNNAADLSRMRQDVDVAGTDLAVWDRLYSANLRGAVVASKLAIPHLLAQPRSAIVNVSSIQSLLGDQERSAYSAMKAGLNALTRSIATAYGKQGLRCNAVCPGPILAPDSSRLPAHVLRDFRAHVLTPEVGTPQQVADVIAFLASDEAAFVTGQVLAVDGGFTSHMHYHMHLAR